VQWDQHVVRVLDPARASCCGNICTSNAGGTASRMKIVRLTRCLDRAPAGSLSSRRTADRRALPAHVRRHWRGGDSPHPGLLALARKHGAALADDGCAAALESGVIHDGYRFLRRWLERRPQLTLCRWTQSSVS